MMILSGVKRREEGYAEDECSQTSSSYCNTIIIDL
jgi:hypothetical protein